MKANELRIGNIVGSIQTDIVKEVDLFLFGEINDDETYLDHLRGIPLTEEWLIKFNGRKAELRPAYDWGKNAEDENYDDEYYSKNYDLTGVYFEDFSDVVFFDWHMVAKNDKDGMYYFIEESTASDESQYLKVISTPMEFVHTFQNYYPAFINEELKLKSDE